MPIGKGTGLGRIAIITVATLSPHPLTHSTLFLALLPTVTTVHAPPAASTPAAEGTEEAAIDRPLRQRPFKLRLGSRAGLLLPPLPLAFPDPSIHSSTIIIIIPPSSPGSLAHPAAVRLLWLQVLSLSLVTTTNSPAFSPPSTLFLRPLILSLDAFRSHGSLAFAAFSLLIGSRRCVHNVGPPVETVAVFPQAPSAPPVQRLFFSCSNVKKTFALGELACTPRPHGC